IECWEKFCADPDGFPDRPGVARAMPLADLLDEQVDLTPRRHLPLPPPPSVSGHELAAAREQLTGLLSALGETLPGPAQGPRFDRATVRLVALNELAKTGAVFIRRALTQHGAPNNAHPMSTSTATGRILTGADIAAGQPPSKTGDVDGDEVRNPPIRPGDVLVPAVARRLTARVPAAEDIGAYPASTV